MTDFAAARQAMVDCQVRPSDVTRYAIIEAMLWAPREQFVPKARRDVAYAGAEVSLAPGRTMLEPRVLAKMLETAAIGSHDLVLDLAPGTGYSTALIARMAEAVVAIEPDADLAETAQSLLSDLEIDNAVVIQGDAAAGDAAHGPFDVIFINGAVEELPPSLCAQLKDGGRLIAVMRQTSGDGDGGGAGGGTVGKCEVLTRVGAGYSHRYVFDADLAVLEGFEKKVEFAF